MKKEFNLNSFWKEDALAHKENCFSTEANQVALGIRMSSECIFAELGIDGDEWALDKQVDYIDDIKRYNDKAEKIVGKRVLNETPVNLDARFPKLKGIGEIFGGKYEFIPSGGEWLSSPIGTIKELETMLDNVDNMDIKDFIYPSNWQGERNRIVEKYSITPIVFSGMRGPVTLAMSIYGEANLIYLYFDAKELFLRFSKTIEDVILKLRKYSIEESNLSVDAIPHGFGFSDDNCTLLNKEMYEQFGLPILENVFNVCSPNLGDKRFQHSDSAMAHLLPLLATVNLTGCNFGPTVMVDDIRHHMPKTRIDGQLAPFTFMRNNKKDIIAEIKRDCEMIKNTGTKGLNISTAGSINNGSSLESMKVIMESIHEYGQYK